MRTPDEGCCVRCLTEIIGWIVLRRLDFWGGESKEEPKLEMDKIMRFVHIVNVTCTLITTGKKNKLEMYLNFLGCLFLHITHPKIRTSSRSTETTSDTTSTTRPDSTHTNTQRIMSGYVYSSRMSNNIDHLFRRQHLL